MTTPPPGRGGAAEILGSSRPPSNRIAAARQVLLEAKALGPRGRARVTRDHAAEIAVDLAFRHRGDRLHERGLRPIGEIVDEVLRGIFWRNARPGELGDYRRLVLIDGGRP